MNLFRLIGQWHRKGTYWWSVSQMVYYIQCFIRVPQWVKTKCNLIGEKPFLCPKLAFEIRSPSPFGNCLINHYFITSQGAYATHMGNQSIWVSNGNLKNNPSGLVFTSFTTPSDRGPARPCSSETVTTLLALNGISLYVHICRACRLGICSRNHLLQNTLVK